MRQSTTFWFCFGLIFTGPILGAPVFILAQAQSSVNSSTQPAGNIANNVVSVSSSVSVQVTNQTIKIKEGMLRSAVINFLSSGPSVLKTSDSQQPDVNTKVVNQINNDTQNIQGIEATNAIVGVEVSKALKTVLSPAGKQCKMP